VLTLRVLEIFDSIQGEGHWTGTPMTFVRLAGCNAPGLGLACAQWCDTRDSWRSEDGYDLAVGEVILQVSLPHLCITGGEPLLQTDGVSRLAGEARGLGMHVHVETNGTVGPPKPGSWAPDGRAFDWAVVSPKPPDYAIAPGWTGLVDELKFIVDDHLTAAMAERVAAAHPEAVVSIQPMWGTRVGGGRSVGGVSEPSRWSTERAMALVMDHPEWRLSLQMHKYLGIR
jgi:7-carboxy-7-deazaguanine synthase